MGTTLGTGVMRSFPVGVPKVMISTMASRDTRAFVGTKDILMLHSVCESTFWLAALLTAGKAHYTTLTHRNCLPKHCRSS